MAQPVIQDFSRFSPEAEQGFAKAGAALEDMNKMTHQVGNIGRPGAGVVSQPADLKRQKSFGGLCGSFERLISFTAGASYIPHAHVASKRASVGN